MAKVRLRSYGLSKKDPDEGYKFGEKSGSGSEG